MEELVGQESQEQTRAKRAEAILHVLGLDFSLAEFNVPLLEALKLFSIY